MSTSNQIPPFFDYQIQVQKDIQYMAEITETLNPNKQINSHDKLIRITFFDKYGTVNNVLFYDYYKYEIKRQELNKLKYFQIRKENFKIQANKIVVSYICLKLLQNIEDVPQNCIIRENSIYEYQYYEKRQTKIFHRSKMIRKFQNQRINQIYLISFSSAFTAILYQNMQLFYNELQSGIIKGPFVLPKPKNYSQWTQFKVSNNGKYLFHHYYLMDNLQIIKELECLYVQFSLDSKQIVLFDLQKNLKLYDLSNHQTIYQIKISSITYAEFTYFDFDQNSLVQDFIDFKFRNKYIINVKKFLKN